MVATAYTLLVRRLPACQRACVKHPKLYWVDPGVARAAKGAQGPVASEEAGPLLEGWIHTMLSTYIAERELGEERLAYWAPAESAKLEVDFVLRRGAELCALEVKAARRIHPGDMAGLRAIADLPEMRRRILVDRGDPPHEDRGRDRCLADRDVPRGSPRRSPVVLSPF